MATNKQTTEKRPESECRKTVTVYIPSDGTGKWLEGALNGVNFRIPTDRAVEIPEEIANVIAESRREIRDGAHAVEAFAKNGGRKLG